jgi:hypothetical protein
MAYASNTELKTYLKITTAGDDALLTALISYSQRYIEQQTHRVFEASADTTRLFSFADANGRELFFDHDICSITTVITDYDGDATTIPATDYVTMPRNMTPYYGIKIKSSSSYDWDYTDDEEDAIAITGKWAYSVTAPYDIKHACLRLAGYFYKQRDAQVFDVTAIPDAGVIQIPQGIPSDVKIIIDNYTRKVQL